MVGQVMSDNKTVLGQLTRQLAEVSAMMGGGQ